MVPSLDAAGLYTRNPTAHKWKAPLRSYALRESTAWRTQDLLEQSLMLYNSNNLLGARILLRSAFETVAVLIYLNQLTKKVLHAKLNFHDFSDKTSKLLLGSRDGSTDHQSINIITVIESCNKRYPGIKDLYAALSESAHPNYEGISIGYSTLDEEKYISQFSNRWSFMYKDKHLKAVELCVDTFFDEYDNEWTDLFDKLEAWIETNDETLEAGK